jgi:hypothetical protein
MGLLIHVTVPVVNALDAADNVAKNSLADERRNPGAA